MADNIPSTQPPVPVEIDDLDLVLAQVQEQVQEQTQSPSSTVPGTANGIPYSPVTIDTRSPRPDLNTVEPAHTPTNTSSPSVPAPPSSSFYDSLEIETELSPKVDQESSSPIMKRLSSTSSLVSPIDTSPLNTNKLGSKKIRAGGSNIARRIELLAAGKNENGSDLHTTTSTSFVSNPSSSGQTTPDPSDYPDSFFEDLLRSEQTTISRSFSTMPKPTPRKTTPTASSSMPLQTSKFGKTSDANGASATDDTLVLSGDLEEDLQRLQAELTKTKEVKAKAEADAKAQRLTVMSLKTEVQLVRNVLKRRETELGDIKDMSGAYETDLSDIRRKLELSERQLSKGQGEMEAKVRALERLRDESVARIQTLDQEIKKLRDQVKALERKNEDAQAEIHGLRSELEELAPFREAASHQRELNAEEPTKVKELTTQITELEDTRDVQAALIEELETKITTVEAEALEFKGKAELEYEALQDGFKVLKTRRSEEIRVLQAELEQHKLQEQIIEKLQSDIDGLQSALALVANSQSTENARINQVTAELNEALALKDQEVVQVRQNMTEFEESHNRLVSSLQATLATINEEADSARKSRDEAVTALESLREELEALRHSLPINNKHMSLSAWSAEQQQLQQEQLKVIEELEEKLDGRVEGVKEDQQRADRLGANTKRKSQQLALDLEHHLQLSNAMVKSSIDQDHIVKDDGASDMATTIISDDRTIKGSDDGEPGTISVRTMLKFLSQLQGRSLEFDAPKTHIREGTDATIAARETEDYEVQLRAYLTRMDDAALLEPWAKEKQMEIEIDRLGQKIQTLLSDLSVANQAKSEALDSLKEAQIKHEASLAEERAQRDHLEQLEREEREEEERQTQEERAARESELQAKELSLQDREQQLLAKEKDLNAKEEERRRELLPITPPFSAPMTPFGSPNNIDLLPGLMATHRNNLPGDGSDDEGDSIRVTEDERQQQAKIAAQQIKLIKTLEDKIADLEKRAFPVLDDQTFPTPPMSRHSQAGPVGSSTTVSKTNTHSMRSSLLANPPDTPPPTIALPPVPISEHGEDELSPRRTRKASMAHSVSSESLSQKAVTEAAIAAAVAAAMAKSQEANAELAAKLAKSEADLARSKSEAKEMEVELTTVLEASRDSQDRESEVQRLRNENRELAQAMEEIRKSLDVALSQSKGLEQLKTQLELQKERQAKDDAIRTQDHLQTQLEEEKQKKKGFLCF
ncbi:hypothetical protein BGZ74_009559 [Mortierella antarctica]|nr:hypothetical protein BGZ74_009559 [Mortierella antarctica]